MHRCWLLVLLLTLSCSRVEEEFDLGPPNVLMIVMDTTRADRCSVDGYGRPTTPMLEKFSRDAVVFTDAWSPSPWTGPSHASIFTGLLPPAHGFMAGTRRYLEEDFETLAEVLDAAGYRTASFSNNFFITSPFGLTQGFETVETLADHPDAGYPTAAWAHERAMDVILASRIAERPFFVFINHIEPHAPYAKPGNERIDFLTTHPDPDRLRHAREFRGMEITRNNVTKEIDPSQWQFLSDLYDGQVATLDAEIGSFLEQLQAEGVLDNTIVLVLADHGENLGDHGLGGHESSLHRTLLRVPLILRYPGTYDGGGRSDALVRLEDLLPTILEACRLSPPAETDGTLIVQGGDARLARAFLGRMDLEKLESECPGYIKAGLGATIRSLYDGRYHLIRYEDGREELYDVRSDPEEARNLVDQAPEVARRMRELL